MGNRTRNKKKNKKKGGPPAKRGPVSDEVLLAEVAVKHTWAKAGRAFVTLLGLALVALACWPVAHALAGEDTRLNVTIALGLTASLTIAGGGVAAWGNYHRKRANRLQTRNERLSRDVKELQGRLRENGLSDEVSRG